MKQKAKSKKKSIALHVGDTVIQECLHKASKTGYKCKKIDYIE